MKRYAPQKAFTLIEVVITATLFFLVVTAVTVLFIEMIKIKGGVDARQNLTKESYYLIEKLQVMSRNYTVDYEEYWNRKQVGCTAVGTSWSGSTNCTMMTYYGNRNVLGYAIPDTDNAVYYCSSASAVGSTIAPVVQDNVGSFPCIPSWVLPGASGFLQSYGQYQTLFADVKNDADDVPGAVGDDDDLDLGEGPVAIDQATGVQELYLISHDLTHRLFIRRKLIEQGDWDMSGITGDNDSEKLYTIQILQLKGLDAGQSHGFQSPGTYDGKIDTRACDASLGFSCHGATVGGAYTSYHLPIDSDDGWVNVLSPDITVSSRNMIISPTKNPLLAWSGSTNQISPHMYLILNTKLYGKNRSNKIPWSQMDLYSIRLQTMLGLPYLGKKN